MSEDAFAHPAEEPERPGRVDLISGLIAMAFGASVLLHVSSFPTMPGGQPGPGLFPGIIAAMMLVLGAILVSRRVLYQKSLPRTGSDAPDVSVAAANKAGWTNAASIIAAIAFYILAVDVLGFIMTMSLVVFILIWRLGTKPLFAGAASVGTVAIIWLTFQRALQVPLPLGFWGG